MKALISCNPMDTDPSGHWVGGGAMYNTLLHDLRIWNRGRLNVAEGHYTRDRPDTVTRLYSLRSSLFLLQTGGSQAVMGIYYLEEREIERQMSGSFKILQRGLKQPRFRIISVHGDKWLRGAVDQFAMPD